MKISFRKNIKDKNDQRNDDPFFVAVPEFHYFKTFPRTYAQQKCD